MKERFLKYAKYAAPVGYPIFYAFCLAIFATLTFPYGKLREHLVAALDHWASLFPKQAIADRLLAVARQVDPDPWKDRFRNLATWRAEAAWWSVTMASGGVSLRSRGTGSETFVAVAVCDVG